MSRRIKFLQFFIELNYFFYFVVFGKTEVDLFWRKDQLVDRSDLVVFLAVGEDVFFVPLPILRKAKFLRYHLFIILDRARILIILGNYFHLFQGEARNGPWNLISPLLSRFLERHVRHGLLILVFE